MASVLLVEDHQHLAQTIVRFLVAKQGYTVVATLQTAEKALEELPGLKVDLVLVDVSLPAMSGIDLVAAIQEQKPALPCLVLSGHNDPAYVRRAMEAGARGYVTKGDPDALLDAVQTVLAGDVYLGRDLSGPLSK